MEEPRSSEPAQTRAPYTGVTAKLSPDDVQSNGTDTQTATDQAVSSAASTDTTASAPAVPAAPEPLDHIQLTVIEGFQVGKGAARIDPSDMVRLGCQQGGIILISGSRTTAARVIPSALVDRGKQMIQMDSQVRQNTAAGLGERVRVRKAKVRQAEKVTLLPLSGGAPIQESDLQYITRYLVGLPVTIGDLLRVGTPGAAPRDFLIISTTPPTPSYTVQRKRTGE